LNLLERSKWERARLYRYSYLEDTHSLQGKNPYVAENLPADLLTCTIIARANAEGYLPSEPAEFKLRSGHKARIRLTLPDPQEISVLVRDARTGTELKDCSVYSETEMTRRAEDTNSSVYGWDYRFEHRHPDLPRTDRHGRVLLQGLRWGPQRLVAHAPGYRHRKLENREAGREAVFELEPLESTVRLVVSARGPEGKPIVGARVLCWHRDAEVHELPAFVKTTDSTGRARFDGLPPGQVRSALDNWRAIRKQHNWPNSDGTDGILRAEFARLRLKLEADAEGFAGLGYPPAEGSVVFSGRVIDENGKGIKGMLVSIGLGGAAFTYQHVNEKTLSVSTGEHGSYRVTHVPVALSSIFFEDRRRIEWNGWPREWQSWPPFTPKPGSAHNFEISIGTRTLRGTFRFNSGPENRAQPLILEGPGPFRTVWNQKQGALDVRGLAPGAYTLRIGAKELPIEIPKEGDPAPVDIFVN
jgi:protocatechuate 3,4-dioxygenase beta subunit